MVKRLSAEIPSSETVLVDSNVLIYLHTNFPLESKHEDKRYVYSKAIGSLLKNNITLITTILNVAEVFGYIERKAFEIYKIKNDLDDSFFKKNFRKLPKQREFVHKEILQAYNEISHFYIFRDATYKQKWMDQFAFTYLQHQYDPSDFIMVSIAEREEITEIITDDKDFYDNSKFTIYTY